MADGQSLFDLTGKTAVITGGSGVLGFAMAQGLAGVGASVVLIGRNPEKLAEKTEALTSAGARAMGIAADVLDEKNLGKAAVTIRDAFGGVDILINSAGGNRPGAVINPDQDFFRDLDIEAFRQVHALNLDGTILPTLVFARSMAEQGRGSIINISSMASQRAITRVMGYSAAKAAVDNFTRWMAVEMAHKYGEGVRVNAIAPGFFLTEQNRALLTNPDGSLTSRAKTILAMTPFKRFGKPEELMGTAIWLASEASAFVSGTVIPVDGAFSAFSGV